MTTPALLPAVRAQLVIARQQLLRREAPTDPFDRVLAALDRRGCRIVRSSDSQVMAQCPAHDDRQPSLSITRAPENGRVLVRCFAGCPAEAIVRALGLRMRDLFPASRPLTLAELADEKGLPIEFLRDGFGVRDTPQGVTIPYYDTKGNVVATKLRMRAGDERRFSWPARLPLMPYGLNLLSAAREAGVLWIAEGETDTWTLLIHGLPTLGLPGASTVRTLQLAYLDGVARIVVAKHRDAGGERFVESLRKRLFDFDWSGEFLVVESPVGKDVNDLHVDNPETFRERLKEATDAARPIAIDRAQANGPVLVRLSDVAPERIEWLWRQRLAVGKLHLLIGDPGLGKSLVTCDLAARITRGTRWPDGEPAPEGDVLILAAEDNPADTIRPRIEKFGGDVSRVQILQGIWRDNAERLFSLTTDLSDLETAIRDTQARFIVLDPLNAYIGSGVDTYRDDVVKRLLAPLTTLASATGACIVGICHLTKNRERGAIHRAQGSVAWVGSARLVLALGKDPGDDQRRLLVGVKSNLAALPAGLAFTITDGPTLNWAAEPVTMDADTLLGALETPAARSAQREAEALLRDLLAGGPVAASDVLKAGRVNGLSETALFLARKSLGIRSVRQGGFGSQGAWVWSMATAPEQK
jgi:putative DNA primase/helicase